MRWVAAGISIGNNQRRISALSGLDHFWLLFKLIFVYWPGGGAMPTNKTESWSSNPVMQRGVAFVILNANAWVAVLPCVLLLKGYAKILTHFKRGLPNRPLAGVADVFG